MFSRMILEAWVFPFVRENTAIKFLVDFMKINMLEMVAEATN